VSDTSTTDRDLQLAIDAARNRRWTDALIIFHRVYSAGVDAAPAIDKTRHVEGLSFYGLALAMGQKKYKQAIEFCRKAADLQFYNSEHSVNLARVYVAAGMRKKAVETLESAIASHPEDAALVRYRKEIGVRARPPIPFLSRSNPLNVALGRMLHAQRVKKDRK
jgi:tetratricopeptide (TPR) repeat protein